MWESRKVALGDEYVFNWLTNRFSMLGSLSAHIKNSEESTEIIFQFFSGEQLIVYNEGSRVVREVGVDFDSSAIQIYTHLVPFATSDPRAIRNRVPSTDP